MQRVEIFTDGACSGNPGAGGWGAILRYKDVEKEMSGGEKETTNNRMEMTAVIKALEFTLHTKLPVNEINIYSDSLYVINTMKGLYSMRTNLDLWARLANLATKLSASNLQINWIHVKGHTGHINNEVVDRLANLLSQTKLKIQ